jgi:hypothetical protein
MSIAVRFPPSNVTRKQYDTARNALTESGESPAGGCQVHVLFGDEEPPSQRDLGVPGEARRVWREAGAEDG